MPAQSDDASACGGGREGIRVNRSTSWRLAAALGLALLLPACTSPQPAPTPAPAPAPVPQVRAVNAEALEIARERRIERRMAVENVIAGTRHVNAIAYPMWTRGSKLCPSTRFRIWAVFRTRADFDEAVTRVYAEVVPLDEQPTIVLTTPGGPAEAAGLQAGDVITAVDGAPLAQGAAGEVALVKALDASQGQPVRLAYLRHGTTLDTVVVPVNSCDFAVYYTDDDEVNAFSDGRRVVVQSGLVHFAESDDELAVVMAHELGHNVGRHYQTKRDNARRGAIIDEILAAGGLNSHHRFERRAAMRYSQDFEFEADRVGLYFAALGSYDLAAAQRFWRRMSAEHTSDIEINYQGTHPSTPQRLVAIEKTIADIKARQALNLPLDPELKGNANQRAAAADAAR